MSAHQRIDEIDLRGKARDLPASGVCFVLGGLLLAGVPFGLLSSGRGLIDTAAEGEHVWIPYLLACSSPPRSCGNSACEARRYMALFTPHRTSSQLAG